MTDDPDTFFVPGEAPAAAPPEVIGQGADHEPRRRARPAARASREMPASDEAEQHVIACCLLDEGTTLTRAHGAGLSEHSFYFPANRTIFATLLTLQARSLPVTLEVLASELGTQLPEVGGFPYLMQVTDKVPTTVHAGYFIERVRELAMKRAIIREAAGLIESAYDGAGLAELRARALALTPGGPPVATPPRPLFSIPLPGESDPSILLGNRYLSRGDGAVLSSSSGMGKSALAIQLATLWGLGRPALGIRAHGALRILYVQSEDSDGDVAEVTQSMRQALALTEPDLALLAKNVVIVTDRVNRGRAFLASLRALIAAHQPDLVIINPLQAFVDGDITQAQEVGAFLRGGLNALNEPAKFAYLLIHHTTKPATGKERSERLWHEVMYDMAGGAEIINWARAILSLRATATEGEFNLVLAKRGRRAGVTREVEQGAGVRLEPVTVIPLRHSQGHLPDGRPMIFWEARTTPDAEAERVPSGGRPAGNQFSDYRTVFPPKSSNGLPLNQLHRILEQQRPIRKDTLFKCLKRWAADGDVEVLPEAGKSDRYRASV